MLATEDFLLVHTISLASSALGGFLMPASLVVLSEDSPVTTVKPVVIFPPDASKVGGFLAELSLTVIPPVDSSVAPVKLVEISPPDTSGVDGLSAVRSLSFSSEDFSIMIVKLMVDISGNDAYTYCLEDRSQIRLCLESVEKRTRHMGWPKSQRS